MKLGGQRYAQTALPRGKTGTHPIRSRVGLRTGLDGCGKSRPHRDSIRGPSSPWRVAISTELSRSLVCDVAHRITVYSSGTGDLLSGGKAAEA
jgi:hypothetical protein